LPDLAAFSGGTDEAPEASATLFIEVRGFVGGQRLRLAGPGLRTPTLLDVDGLPPEFPSIWASNHARYPCGIDIVICAGATLVALPRSVAVFPG